MAISNNLVMIIMYIKREPWQEIMSLQVIFETYVFVYGTIIPELKLNKFSPKMNDMSDIH